MKKTMLALVSICLFSVLGVATEKQSLKIDGSFITSKGKIDIAKPSYFVMVQPNGERMVVEMDDWDWYKEGNNLRKGDEVIVYGEVDNDHPEGMKIEADSVYVKGLDTYFYANSTDEEDYPEWHDYHLSRVTYIMPSEKIYMGEVTNVYKNTFTIKQANNKRLKISIKDLGYNPLDNIGLQKINVGDTVAITGDFKNRFWGLDKVIAEDIVNLENDNGSSYSMID